MQDSNGGSRKLCMHNLCRQERVAALANIDEQQQQPMLKKRVVLGELHNLSNVVLSVNSGAGDVTTQKQKINKSKPSKAKKATIDKKDELLNFINSIS